MKVPIIDINPGEIRIDKGVIARFMGVDADNIPEPYRGMIQKELDETDNLTATKEQRAIRVVKERYRALWHRLPYKAIPRIMIKIGVMEMVRWPSAFPPKGRVSTE